MSAALKLAPYEGFPTDIEWPSAFQQAACAEGWDLFDCDSDNGRTQLQRNDDSDALADDSDAWKLVCSKAREGSEMHRAALKLVAKYNSPETLLIFAAGGPVDLS